MILKPFDAVDKTDIDALIANCVNEFKTLEYKQTLPGSKDDDKKEFLADVSSFANASGGDIVYGIKAAVDANGKKTGAPDSVVPIVGITADQAKLRLEETIRNGIDSRLRVQIKEIAGWDTDRQSFVILLRIPKSFASPHMVTFKGTSRFYSRHSSGKYQLDVGEIRTAVLATDSQADRIKRFREDRLDKIIADEVPVTLSSPHRFVLHMIPIASFLNNERLNLPEEHALVANFRPIHCSDCSRRYNLDGFVTFGSKCVKNQGHDGYCQLFFNGALEAAYADVLRDDQSGRVCGGTGTIASLVLEQYLIEAIQAYLQGFIQLGLPPPVMISLALLGCKGSRMYVDIQHRLNAWPAIDRDTVILPDVVIDSLDADVPQTMKPLFDAVWNACGFPRSLNYDKDGNRRPRR